MNDVDGVADAARQALTKLVGLRLSAAHNAGNMKTLQFGDLQKRGEKGLVGQFALHIQCPWRIERLGKIVTGSLDYYERASDNTNDAWEPGAITGHLQNEILGRLFEGLNDDTRSHVNRSKQLVVEEVTADSFGGARIRMSGDYNLVIFPSGTKGEDWRLFEPSKTPHFFIEDGKAVLE